MVESLGVGYQPYVETGLASTDEEFRTLYQQARLSLGNDEFREKMSRAHERVAQRARRREDVAFRRKGDYRSVTQTLAAVAEVFQVPESGLCERRRNAAVRGAAAWC